MKSTHAKIVFTGALVSTLVFGAVVQSAETGASSLDEALRAGNIQDVLKILGPGANEAEPTPPRTAPAPPPKDDAKRHRITLFSGDGTVRDLSRTSAGDEPRVARPAAEPPKETTPAPSSTVTTVTVDAGEPATDTRSPRRALPAAQPVQVPLTRPRPGEANPVEADTKQPLVAETTPKVTIVSAPAGAMEAPENREQASKELATLLKTMGKEPDVVIPAVSPVVPATTTANTATVIDEDKKISKPLGEASRSITSIVPRTSVTVVSTDTRSVPATTSASGVDDPMQTTRRQLDRLLQEAKQETFGNTDGVMMGQGTLYHPEGWQYTGEWRNGKMDGQGALIYPDGWKYVGDWRDGKMHGKGELIHPRNASAR